MTILANTGPARGTSRGLTSARLLSIAGAVPPLATERREMCDRLARLWNLQGESVARWARIVEGSCIDRRYTVRAPEEVVHLGTAARMTIFADEAPALAADAARKALAAAGVSGAMVTDLIVVTCTGFKAPGIDVEVVDRLGLSPGVRRSQIGFMGCFGAITGLRTAAGACCADRSGVALLVCVELCSLHARADDSLQNQVCCALFGDAAVAAVIVGEDAMGTGLDPAVVLQHASQSSLGLLPIEAIAASPLHASPAPSSGAGRRIGLGRSALLPEGRGSMTWTVTDAGFAMTLSRDVPSALRSAALELAETIPSGAGIAVHPGGAAILDLIDEALDLRGGRGLEHARAVLREYGNVSSGTVLLVAERVMASSDHPLVLMAFGPGLTVELAVLGGAGLSSQRGPLRDA